MFSAQSLRSGVLTWATAATNSTSSVRVDRLGYDYAVMSISMPAATATNSSAKWGALTVSHGDSTAISSATAITSLTGSTATSVTQGFAISAHNDTSNPSLTKLQVDCRGRGRYLFLTYQCAASHQTAFASYDLYRGQQAADTDTERNVTQTVIG